MASSIATHLRALLWREALLLRQSKVFTLLQWLVSCLLLVGAAVAVSHKALSAGPSRWALPTATDSNLYCDANQYVLATPATYVSNVSTILRYMQASQSVAPYPPPYPSDLYNGNVVLMVNGSAVEAAVETLVPPYINHIFLSRTTHTQEEKEGEGDDFDSSVFLATQPNVRLGPSTAMCFPYYFPLAFDYAAVPALQTSTSIRTVFFNAAMSRTTVFITLSSMAVVAAMIPAIASLASRLTTDKTSRLREHLKIMGMRNTAYYGALHLVLACKLLPVAIGAAVAMAVAAPKLLSEENHPSDSIAPQAMEYFACAAVGGLSMGLWVQPLGLIIRKPILTTSATIAAVFVSAATVFIVFLPSVVPSSACWPLLLLFGAPAGTVGALAGLLMRPIGGLSVSPGASLGAAMLSGLFWGLVGEYWHALYPGDYGVPQSAGYPLRALLHLLQSIIRRCRSSSSSSSSSYEEKVGLLDETDIATPHQEAHQGGGQRGSANRQKKAVEIRSLWKVFGDEAAVRGLNLDVHYGEILALLGHNGAGKSTTVSVLTGMLPATRFKCCKVGGRDVALDIDGVREVIGVCPQMDILMPDLSATEHMRFFGALRGVDNRERGLELLQCLDLPLTSQKAGTFSGGMQRRLSLALALCTHSPVLFLDEPSSGLDPVHRRQVWDLLRKERAEGRGIILTTHFMEEAEVLGDRVAIMAKGRLRCCDTTAALKARYGVGDMLHLSSSGQEEGEGSGTGGEQPPPQQQAEKEEHREGANSTLPATPKANRPLTMDVAAITRLVHTHFPHATIDPSKGISSGGEKNDVEAITVTIPRHYRQHQHRPQGQGHEEKREFASPGADSTANTAADDLDRLAAVLAALEQQPTVFGVAACTVTQTTIEDVFLRIADDMRTANNKSKNKNMKSSTQQQADAGDVDEDLQDEVEEEGDRRPAMPAVRQYSSVSMPDARSIDTLNNGNKNSNKNSFSHATQVGDLLSYRLADGVTTAADLLFCPQDAEQQHQAEAGTRSSLTVFAALRLFAALWKMRIDLLFRGTFGLPVLLPLVIAAAALASLASTNVPVVTRSSSPSSRSSTAASVGSAVSATDVGAMDNSFPSFVMNGFADDNNNNSSGPVFGRVSPIVNRYAFAGTIGLIYNADACDAADANTFAIRMQRCLQSAAAPGTTIPNLDVVPRADVLNGFYPLERGSLIATTTVPSMLFLDALSLVINASDASYFQMRLLPASLVTDTFPNNDPFSMLVPLCAQRAFSTMVTGLDASRGALPLRFGTLPLNNSTSPSNGPPAPTTNAPPTVSIHYVRQYSTLPYSVLGPLAAISATAAALPMLADLLDRSVYAKLRLHGAPARLFWLAVAAADATVVVPALLLLIIAPSAMDIPELRGTSFFFTSVAVLVAVFVFNALLAGVLVLSLPRHLPTALVVGTFSCGSLVLTLVFAAPHLISPSPATQVFGMLNVGAVFTTTVSAGNKKPPMPPAAVAIGAVFSVLALAAFALRLALEPSWKALRTQRRLLPSTAPDHINGADDEDVRAEAATISAWRAQDSDASSTAPRRVVAALVKAWRVFPQSPQPLVAVRGMSCGVRLGECFGLLGPNGAGKTTAIGLLTAQDAPTGGERCAGNRTGEAPVHAYAPSADRLASQDAAHAALPMGLCSQHDTLFPTMTAEQHLMFYLSLRTAANGPWQPALWTEYIHEVLRRVGLGNVIGTKKPAGVYSGGMKRKLQVAIAMYTGGRLCVLDEPSTGMDPGARRFLWAAIHSALEGGERSVLLTTHSMEEAENACTRLAIMQHGQLRCIGTPEHLRARFGDDYTLTVGMPAPNVYTSDENRSTAAAAAAAAAAADDARKKEDAIAIAALHTAIAETIGSIAEAAAVTIAGAPAATTAPSAITSAAGTVRVEEDKANPLRPAEVLGGRVLIYKIGQLSASLSSAYSALAHLQRRFPAVTITLAQNTSLEQIFVSVVGRG